MKPHFNMAWVWIAAIIILNIVIFYFMSKKLESFVEVSVAKSNIEKGL